MNATIVTLTEDKRYEFGLGPEQFCSVANRSATVAVYVDLLDEKGSDTYELTGQGDRLDIDLTGARTMTIRAASYPTTVLLNLTNQRATLVSPSLDVIGGLNAVSPLPITQVSTQTPTFFDYTEQAGDPVDADGVVRVYGKTTGLYYIDDEAVVHGPLTDQNGALAGLSIVTGAGAPAAIPPAAGTLPFYYDTTAATGGLYIYYGGAWHKVAGTT
jgi:hypothetical protein